ncbi:MAG TPA: 2,5-diamino-6-(ribosylamino)-4(3H)-pyrimidinone 5'-phosphate reductase [Methanobacterium sp.]|jgi:2,5-diamino-6-(ribosylamino)-4(3H)-pyrimidinone 5'-phosphate reductase|nr:MAG: 2,5-diamino-6-(ribosylamino)-4(3H)-pyrimidinone 5'-phosphate reductase [Methanobacterium sp.]HOI71560.1 2,5-diamino-6-(ribosylamino)-4(3H)-pyrimidinone 5'-phosphate reductase [Methanobacterium sp.]
MKPYIILNSAMTLDGKIATRTGSSEISGPEDLQRVHQIRKELDAIMVGINTVLEDDPRLTVHKFSSEESDNPLRVVTDSKAITPINSRVLNEEAETLIAVSQDAPRERVKLLMDKGDNVDVILAGETRVDLTILMDELAQRGIRSILLEGGSTLNYSMLKDGLVDEIRVCIAPMIAGGVKAKTLADGEGVDYMKDAFKLELKKSYKLGKDFILEYEVLK